MRFLSIPLFVFLSVPSLVLAEPPIAPPPGEGLTEISVVGDAPFIAPPDFLTVEVKLEQTAATAVDAFSQLDARSTKIAETAAAACPSASAHSRGDKILPLTGALLNLKSGSPLSVQRTLAVDCAKVEQSGKLIDALLNISGNTIVDVSYSVRNSSGPVVSAIELAGKRGAEKAAAMASALGVKLGALVSSVATEEPEGDALREQLHQGQPALDFGDKRLRVYVQLRYNIAH